MRRAFFLWLATLVRWSSGTRMPSWLFALRLAMFPSEILTWVCSNWGSVRVDLSRDLIIVDGQKFSRQWFGMFPDMVGSVFVVLKNENGVITVQNIGRLVDIRPEMVETTVGEILDGPTAETEE